MNRDPKRRYWLDDPRNVNLIVRILATVCVLLVLLDLVIDKHPHFSFEGWFGFFGFFGFLAFFLLVLAGKQLRRVLMRDEDYYDR